MRHRHREGPQVILGAFLHTQSWAAFCCGSNRAQTAGLRTKDVPALAAFAFGRELLVDIGHRNERAITHDRGVVDRDRESIRVFGTSLDRPVIG